MMESIQDPVIFGSQPQQTRSQHFDAQIKWPSAFFFDPSLSHNRSCAYDSGKSPVRSLFSSAGGNSAPLRLAPSTRTLNSLTVGASNKLLNGNSTCNPSRIRDITCVANNECPPNSKKLSSIPT